MKSVASFLICQLTNIILFSVFIFLLLNTADNLKHLFFYQLLLIVTIYLIQYEKL